MKRTNSPTCIKGIFVILAQVMLYPTVCNRGFDRQGPVPWACQVLAGQDGRRISVEASESTRFGKYGVGVESTMWIDESAVFPTK